MASHRTLILATILLVFMIQHSTSDSQDVKFGFAIYMVDSGATAVLDCFIIPSKTFDGIYDASGHKIETSLRRTIKENDKLGVYQLIIRHARSIDGGKYKCKAKGSTGEDEAEATLSIRASIEKAEKLYNISLGGTGKIELTVTGYPRPEITWEKVEEKDGYRTLIKRLRNGKVIGDLRYGMSFWGSLVIENVKLADAGSYRVSASFRGGVATKIVKVKVVCEDLNTLCNIFARMGDCKLNPNYMSFHCRRSCNTCP